MAEQTHSASVCDGSETPLGSPPGQDSPFPFYFTILPPCKASWPPAAYLGLSLPQRGAQPGSETRRSERAWGLPTACGNPPRGVVQMVGRLSPCAGEPAGGGDRGYSTLPWASASLLPGGAGPPPHFPLSLGDL